MPREGQSMEDVLRNACSMVLKDVTRLLDRVRTTKFSSMMTKKGHCRLLSMYWELSYPMTKN